MLLDLKSLASTDERFKYPERFSGVVTRGAPMACAFPPARAAKDAQVSQPGVPRGAIYLQVRCCSVVRDSFFPKINFTEFHFRFILLITSPRGRWPRHARTLERSGITLLRRGVEEAMPRIYKLVLLGGGS
jgi:hypothetical protein